LLQEVDFVCQQFELQGTDGRVRMARRWQPSVKVTGRMGIVHGLGEHAGRYHHWAESFCRAGIEVVAFDLIGHGLSGGPRGHVSDYALLLDDIGLLVRELERHGDRRPRWLYGHSLGGNLVLNYALRRSPDLSGLIITSPLLLPACPPPRWKRMLAAALNHLYPSAVFSTAIDPADLSHDPQAVRCYREDPLVHDRVSVRLGVQMLAAGRWALEHAEQLALPTLLMHGTGDRITSASASQRFAQRAGSLCTLKLWPDLYHELQWETDRILVLATIRDWLGQPC
jgi:alpha-beta hydrolase superfamily lysophospholipase